jgi:putative lipoprotein
MVTGTVTYRLRIALQPEAVVRVSLSDVSGAPPALVARITIPTRGRQPPIPFALPYDPAQIDPGAPYAVDARIEVEGRLLFATIRPHPVITGGHPTSGIELVVDPPSADRSRPR